jgi:hypothetical protein
MVSMKQLDNARRAQVVRCLCEGNSIRSTVRITGVAKNTVVRLLIELAEVCADYHDTAVRNVRVRRLQCDEIWQFVGARKRTSHLSRRRRVGAMFGHGRQLMPTRNCV